MAKLTPEKKGLRIIFDDLNGLATSEAFANWLKSFMDETATAEKQIPLVFILAGLPERRQQLLSKQPALDRVFDLIEIKRFSPEETRELYSRVSSTRALP